MAEIRKNTKKHNIAYIAEENVEGAKSCWSGGGGGGGGQAEPGECTVALLETIKFSFKIFKDNA